MIFPIIMNKISKIFNNSFRFKINDNNVLIIDNEVDLSINNDELIISGHVFTFLGREKKKGLLLPVNFIPEKHIIQFPPYENGFPQNINFDIDKMNYFLSLLSSIPANNKDLISEDGYVPIFSTLVRDHIKDYLKYVDYLVKTNVIYCNHSFVIGKKSKSYKWTEKYENSGFSTANYSKVNEDNEAESTNNLDEIIVGTIIFPYLKHWYQQKKLTINLPIAYRYAQNLRDYKIQDKKRWDDANEVGTKKNPHTQYKAILYNLESLKNHNYRLLIDSNVHRLHSVLTNMQKDFRNLLTYNNQSLVSIDVKNCQPYLACVIFNPEFWKENSNIPLNIKSLPINIQTRLNEFSISIMIGNLFENLELTEFDDYIHLVSSGRMYETIVDIVKESKGVEIKRSTAKTTMFNLIFSKNRGVHLNPNKYLLNIYKQRFPTVTRLFKIIKTAFKGGDKEQHSRLACLLQAIESEIILHRCCKRIWEEGEQKIPIFTIHDSIVTTLDNMEYVRRVMEEELTYNIGIAPSLSVEYWDISNLDSNFLT